MIEHPKIHCGWGLKNGCNIHGILFPMLRIRSVSEFHKFSTLLCVGDGSHSSIAAGTEPDAHQFMSRFVYDRGDRMEINSDDIVSTPKLGQACMGKWGLRYTPDSEL